MAKRRCFGPLEAVWRVWRVVLAPLWSFCDGFGLQIGQEVPGIVLKSSDFGKSELFEGLALDLVSPARF